MDALIKIGFIDNDQMLLQGMTAWIAGTGDIDLVATATSVEEYLAARPTAPIVILDLNLENYTEPAHNVANLVRTGLQVIVASVIPDRAYIVSTTEAGAAAYITKNNNLDALAGVIRAVHEGRTPTTPEHAFWLSRDDRPLRPHLSPREYEILRAVGNGEPHKAIAHKLHIAVSTVQTHLERVRHKYLLAGRPIENPGDYRDRIREDGLGRERLGPDVEGTLAQVLRSGPRPPPPPAAPGLWSAWQISFGLLASRPYTRSYRSS
jgi:two-component system nitrate/nitrite response regulator NarL